MDHQCAVLLNFNNMPTIDIPDKICPHCGNTSWYYKPSSPNFYECHIKRKETHKKVYEDKKHDSDIIAKKKIWMRNWRQANKDHVRKYKLDYDKTENGKKAKSKRSSYAIVELRDYYIRSILNANLPVKLLKEDIPQDLIDLERKNLIIKRSLHNTDNHSIKQCVQCGIAKTINKFESPGTLKCYACCSRNYSYRKKLKQSAE